MSILKNLALILLSTLLTALIIEGAVRIWAPQSVAVPWQDEVDGITAPRPSIHGRHAVPNTFDVTVSFNSQRFRSRNDYQTEPPLGVLRLAILGDSFTFGYGANDSETYPAQLEQALGRVYKSSRLIVEAINAGNGGTGTGEQALWYDRWVKRFFPQLVILTVVSNDVDDDLGRRLFMLDDKGEVWHRPRSELKQADQFLRAVRYFTNKLPGYDFLAEHSQLVGFLRNAVSSMIGSFRGNAFANAQQLTPGTYGQESFHKIGLPLLQGEVKWLRDRVQESGGQLIVVFVPSRESIYPSRAPWAGQILLKSKAITNALISVCSRNEIPFADLTSLIRERAKQQDVSLFYDGLDVHPTPNGYRTIAEGVAEFIVARRLLQPGIGGLHAGVAGK